jgi:hypothetical protein
MNIRDVTVENSVNPFGPKFYFLHRDNIRKQIAEIQKKRGVACPSHVAQWQLRSVNGNTANTLLPYNGRKVRFPNE